MKTAWCVIAVVVILCLVWLFAFRSRPIPAETRVTEHGAESIDSSENISNSLEGHLQRSPLRTKAKPEEVDEIKMKGRELFARYQTVAADIAKQDYQTALEKLVEYYTWTLENDYAPSAGVRGSFGISEWRKLVAVYPPAADKLREMADSLEETMRTTPMSEVAFDPRAVFSEFPQEVRDGFVAKALMRDICNFNDVLGTNERSMDLLVDLAKNDPELVMSCWRGAEDMLYDAKAYDILQVCIPDLNAEYDRVLDTLQRTSERSLQVMQEKFKDNPAMLEMNQRVSQASLGKFVAKHVGRLLDFGVATGQTEVVSELAKRTAEEFPDTADLFEKYQ